MLAVSSKISDCEASYLKSREVLRPWANSAGALILLGFVLMYFGNVNPGVLHPLPALQWAWKVVFVLAALVIVTGAILDQIVFKATLAVFVRADDQTIDDLKIKYPERQLVQLVRCRDRAILKTRSHDAQ